ncbi:MAG: porin, partial [Planctomycetota bacterium]
RPYGLDHLNSSRYNVFIGRPNVIEAFNEDTRRLGFASYGVSDDLRYNWRYGIWNLERIQDDGIYIGDAYQMQVAGRMATTYWWDEPSDGRGYGHFAIAGTVADPDETGGPLNSNEARFRTRPEARTGDRWLNTGRIPDVERFNVLGLEHVLNYGAFQWVSEAQVVSNNRNNGAEDATFHGAYTYVSYFLTGEHMPWNRESGTLGRVKPLGDFFLVRTCDGGCGGGWGAWQIAARYSYLDLNDADVFGGIADSFTLGVNWYWNDAASLQFNYVNGAIRDSAVVSGVGAAGDPIDSRYDILGLRIRLDF